MNPRTVTAQVAHHATQTAWHADGNYKFATTVILFVIVVAIGMGITRLISRADARRKTAEAMAWASAQMTPAEREFDARQYPTRYR